MNLLQFMYILLVLLSVVISALVGLFVQLKAIKRERALRKRIEALENVQTE